VCSSDLKKNSSTGVNWASNVISGTSIYNINDDLKWTFSEEAAKYKIDKIPGVLEKRVFIGGNYIFMPIIREIEILVKELGFQPIIAFDFDIPREKTRDYSLRLLTNCKYAIFEITLAGGQLVEEASRTGLDINTLQLYMALDENKEPPKSCSVMDYQRPPQPQGYLTIKEMKEIIISFLLK